MDKRKLSKIPRIPATKEMCKKASQKEGIRHIVTVDMVDEIIQLTVYNVESLKEGNTEAEFRTFMSEDDYITQNLKTEKTKWIVSSFAYMEDFTPFVRRWNGSDWVDIPNVLINSKAEEKMLQEFFAEYRTGQDDSNVWAAIYKFQEKVREARLDVRDRKVTDVIDKKMESIKEAPKEFFDWVWEVGMSFSRYLIYKNTGNDKAQVECTHCGQIGEVDRKNIRLRNNEKGVCPFCGSKVTIKAKGRMAYQTRDSRWFMYVDSQEDGFLLRYFYAQRETRNDKSVIWSLQKNRTEEFIGEYSRCFYKFDEDGKITKDSYEWGVYKQRGDSRWCPDVGNISCMECILYPGNLPAAWEHTPFKYSALEVLSTNMPTKAMRYEDAMARYLKFPKLEWICKMGLNNLARNIISGMIYGNLVGKIDYEGKTIYEILGLTKVNTRILQEVDGNHYVLRLLQVSQEIGLQFKAEQLKEYYETFECNTRLLERKNRKVSLHKLVKYIEKESERYPLQEHSCWNYGYMRYQEREDPRIERKKNMAHDWLEYLEWCEALGYDLNNMFFYMPNNFKKVHDRTAKEYQALQDKKAAEEMAKKEKIAFEKMQNIKHAMEDIFKKNECVDAFNITGKGLILRIPTSADEIRQEGATLHHCVATYVNKVAEGKTMILFIRQEKSPDNPYYTMEWNGEKVVQCRGYKNCDMTPEVRAFTKAFEKKMKKELQKSELRRCG